MRNNQIGAILSAVAWLLAATPAFAQHEGHQMPAAATTATGNAGACAQNAKGITAAIDQTSARIEDARQSNDPARLRAAVGDVQTMLAQMKAQLGDCVSLTSASAGSMGNMASDSALEMTLTSNPSPPRSGDNTFEVVVKDTTGKPVSDATVSLAFYMPPMPAMKMPAMRNTIPLSPAGNGVYRGTGAVMMGGAWDVTMTVSRGGQTLGVKTVTLKAE